MYPLSMKERVRVLSDELRRHCEKTEALCRKKVGPGSRLGVGFSRSDELFSSLGDLKKLGGVEDGFEATRQSRWQKQATRHGFIWRRLSLN